MRSNISPLLAVVLVVAAQVALGQTDSLILSSGSTASNGTVSLNLNLTSLAGNEPAGIQWTLTYPQSHVIAVTVTAGPAATAAGKTLSCFAGSGTYTCVVSGLNTTTISNGTVAFVDLTMAAAVSASSIGLSNALGSSASGTGIVVLPAGGVVTGAGAPVTPSGLACVPASIGPNASSTCTVTLNQAAATGGSSVTLSSNNLALSAPALVFIAAGFTSATFSVTTGNVSGSQSATLSATLSGVSKSATISMAPSMSAEFNDVPPSASYFDATNLMFEAGLTTGCVQGSTPQTRSFCPNDTVTREQAAAFIVRAVTGTTTPAIYNPTPYFTDVPTTDPFFPHIQKLVDLGITSGCAPGQFCPSDTIPRWQIAIFIIRARLTLYGASFATATTPYFADVPADVERNGVPFPFIQRAYEERITNGCGTNPLTYCPDDVVTRGQMASLIMRGLFNETTIAGLTAPQVTGVSPNTMASTVGAQITVTITGANTNFQSGDTVTVPSGMLAVGNVNVNSANSITATLSANTNVASGPQALVVTSGGQNLTLPLAIKVGTY
jgi:hypothetical protein